ncbi:DUF1127 domain-containing protein [Nereida sp. MMG025]|uniref:DUF1127 domain-containing protein n=1 Tax=Nereida sp. MMG025 TaxID=2909981 RepID=UPI001F2BCE03|nr:DUF1127 domain-containing protein [Nereida sp. MMG025]MCF6444972.1 DUF1127 domain-containing protein [Nereida sp. MMG025]
MAVIDTTRLAPAQGFGRIMKTAIASVATLKDWNDKRITRNALTKLTLRELGDIGLSRGDIENF